MQSFLPYHRRPKQSIRMRVLGGTTDGSVPDWEKAPTDSNQYKARVYQIVGIDDSNTAIIVSTTGTDSADLAVMSSRVLRHCVPGEFIKLEDVALGRHPIGAAQRYPSSYVLKPSTTCSLDDEDDSENISFVFPAKVPTDPRVGKGWVDDKGFLTKKGLDSFTPDRWGYGYNAMVRTRDI